MTTELREIFARLQRIRSEQGPIVSVYLNLGPDFNEARSIRARLKNLLDPIEDASNGHDHDRRLAIRSTVSRILNLETRIAATRDKCVAIYMGGQPSIEELLVLPRKTWDVAVADNMPYLRPLHAALDSFRTVAAVVVDPRRSEVWVSNMGNILDHAVVASEPVRKADFAGWHGLEEHRTRNHAEEVVMRHFKELKQQLLEFNNRHSLEAIFVGGRDETVKAFVGHLTEPIQNLVVDTFVVDVHTTTPAIVVAITSEMEERFERRLELEQVEKTLETARAGGLAAIGLSDTLGAINQGAIDHLMVHGQEMEPGWACNNCGWLNANGPDCPGCGGQAESVADILERLVARTIDQGASVEHVMTSTELDVYRVAARLRFQPAEAL